MNIPNLLTIARVVMVMIFVILAANAGKVFFDTEGMPQSVYYIRLSAYILAILAGITDLLDGYLARRWNQITATMLMAVEYQLMPAWIVVLVISREFMVTGLRTMAAKRNVVISADRWGKLKTSLQMTMLAIAGGSWVGWFDLRYTKFAGVGLWTLWIIFLCGIVAVTVFSGLAYFVRYRHVFMTPAAEKSE